MPIFNFLKDRIIDHLKLRKSCVSNCLSVLNSVMGYVGAVIFSFLFGAWLVGILLILVVLAIGVGAAMAMRDAG